MTSNISFGYFFLILLPYIIVSLIFLITVLLFIPKEDITIHHIGEIQFNGNRFLKRVIKDVDYYLLLTFIALFVLIGNLENIAFFNTIFKNIIIGNECCVGSSYPKLYPTYLQQCFSEVLATTMKRLLWE